MTASSTVQQLLLTRMYRGIRAAAGSVAHEGRCSDEHRPALASSVCASSAFDFAPRLILTLVNSLCSLVLCRRTACLMGPSPACMPLASRRSCMRRRARFRDVILRSSFKSFVASRTSLNTGLSVMDLSYTPQAAYSELCLTLQRLDDQRCGSLPVPLSNRRNYTLDGSLLAIKFVKHLSCLEVEIHCAGLLQEYTSVC